MGVPQFYSWLTSRYPLIKVQYDPIKLPIIDHLYLDLNSIIYRCVLDETSVYKSLIQGKKFEVIWMSIFNYINQVIQLIQPKEMVFLALDGVAPRAKMNQQRSRRFKSAKKYSELDEALRKNGILEKEEHFKNNSISPGTEFMHELNKQLKFFINRKILEDDEWKKIQIIFSGSDVAGEGEHKIIEYIRRKSQQLDSNPNKKICLYGADADLIMLALTLHLPYVVIFRETIEWKGKVCCPMKRNESIIRYEMIYINVLREYFALEYETIKEKIGERYNIERIIDDFIFLCFFIGNDFLPRVFCMDIKKGTFDQLIEVFKQTQIELNGYINNKGIISWDRAVILFKNIAELELILITEKLEGQKSQNKVKRGQFYEDDDYYVEPDIQEIEDLDKIKQKEVGKMESLKELRIKQDQKKNIKSLLESNNKPNPVNLLAVNSEKNTIISLNGFKASSIVDSDITLNNSIPPLEKFVEDAINLGIPGYRVSPEPIENNLSSDILNEEAKDSCKVSNIALNIELNKDINFMQNLITMYKAKKTDAQKYFYLEKFKLNIDENPSEFSKILTSYIEGLQFVLGYYYTNVPSWSWFFPYHYSPLVSDLSNLLNILNKSKNSNLNIQFQLGKPFEPFKQLLLIMPPNSAHLLPQLYQHLILDPNKPLYKYYPEQFELDPFGAAFESEYIALIPFVDEKILESEFETVDKSLLKPEELERNKPNKNILIYWCETQPETLIYPTVPFFKPFLIRCQNEIFNLEEIKFDPEKILTEPPKNILEYEPSFPSLNFLKNRKFLMKTVKKNKNTFQKAFLKFNLNFDSNNLQEYLDKSFYHGYPFLINSKLIGILTKDTFISNHNYKEFLPYIYDTSKCEPEPSILYNEYFNYYIKEYETNAGILLECGDIFAILEESISFRKQFDESLQPIKLYRIIPTCLIQLQTQFESKYRGQLKINSFNKIEEFPENHEILISINPNEGCVGNVINSIKDQTTHEIEVLIKKPYNNHYEVTRMISEKYDSHIGYKDIKEVADNLGLSTNTILVILDSVFIKSDKNNDLNNIYAEKFDIGLNLIKKRSHCIVPELIICHKIESNKFKSFPNILISPEIVKVIQEYYTNFKDIFIALEKQSNTIKREMLEAKIVFKESLNPNLELLKGYIWLLKNISPELLQANAASKVLSRKGIEELEKMLNSLDSNHLINNKLTKRITCNPNYLIPKHIDTWIAPFFPCQPPWQFIGDRIINLKCNGYNSARFGQAGTITGILGNEYGNGIMNIKIEVVFDEPFIGGTNLGGRCSWGRGAIVNYDEIFNLTRWPKILIPRQPGKVIKGWDGYFKQEYIPKFYNIHLDLIVGNNDTKSKIMVEETCNENFSKEKIEIISKSIDNGKIHDIKVTEINVSNINNKVPLEEITKQKVVSLEYKNSLPNNCSVSNQNQSNSIGNIESKVQSDSKIQFEENKNNNQTNKKELNSISKNLSKTKAKGIQNESNNIANATKTRKDRNANQTKISLEEFDFQKFMSRNS